MRSRGRRDWYHAGGGGSNPATDTICGLSTVLVGVHALNTTCGIVGRLNGFRGIVVDHENRHQNSLNECIRAVNPRRVPYVEESTGTYDDVNRDLERAWPQVVDDLRDAVKTLQITRTSNGKVRYYPGYWKYGVAMAVGHGDGRNGC